MTIKNTTETDEPARVAALALLREGIASPSEAAELAGVSRQLVRFWLTAANIDWRKARTAYLARSWRKAIRR